MPTLDVISLAKYGIIYKNNCKVLPSHLLGDQFKCFTFDTTILRNGLPLSRILQDQRSISWFLPFWKERI